MSTKTTAIIDCPHCAVRVEAVIAGWLKQEEDLTLVLVKCPTCKNALFGASAAYDDEQGLRGWGDLDRIWPSPIQVELSPSIPKSVQRDLKDAQKCYSHGIYSATAVLCGRAFERLVKEKVGDFMIAKGIAALKAKGIIDERLHDWAKALNKERNIGAHASEEEITKDNARDVLDFTIAIFDYVYTLTEKYQSYLARKAALRPPSA